MNPIERYILGPAIDIGDRTIMPVVRIISIASLSMAMASIDPAGILVRDGEERLRIALTDYISWDKIEEEIPEVREYQDPVTQHRDERNNEEAGSDLKGRTDSGGPDSCNDDPDQ